MSIREPFLEMKNRCRYGINAPPRKQRLRGISHGCITETNRTIPGEPDRMGPAGCKQAVQRSDGYQEDIHLTGLRVLPGLLFRAAGWPTLTHFSTLEGAPSKLRLDGSSISKSGPDYPPPAAVNIRRHLYGFDSCRSTTSESVWPRRMPRFLPSGDQWNEMICSESNLVICRPGDPSSG
jgi:hypothetical protein